MTPDVFIKGQLAALAIREGALHGGVNNIVAVAMVMRNRANAGWYGGEWMEILQNATERAGTRSYASGAINLRDPSVRQFLQRIDDIYDGSEDVDLSAGALFYCELHRVDGEWFKQNILKNREDHPMVATVGPVTFFR
jgi:hypothetical protein